MIPCPGRDSLRGLLDESLEAPALEEIIIHIEICPSCQELLEELTRGLRWKSTAPELSGVQELEIEQAIGESNPAAEGTQSPTDDILRADSKSTNFHGATSNGSTRSESARRRTKWPTVPGYEILDRLGEGGMGVVYKVRQVGLNRLVALKMIRAGSQDRPDLLTRFSIEAKAVARLRHPNILQIYDIGEVDGSPYVSLELLEGGSLAARLKATPQSGRLAAELLETLALAINAAHHAGIIHRDLKPSNVLFTAEGTPKVTDFGLAKLLESDDRHTVTGQVMGSPSYMAPEQARGHSRDIRPTADVYALGAILYEMLTGRPPFKGETPIETIRQVIDDEPVPPSRLVPRLPRDLETISLKCLNKEPHKRYESAQALAGDLRCFIEGKPIKARPTPFWERGAKWARRRPVKALSQFLGTAAALLAIGSAVVYDRYKVQQDAMARETNSSQIFEAQAKARSDPEGARTDLVVVRSKISAHPANQQDLDARARSLIAQIDERQAEDRSRVKNQARLKEFFRAKQVAFTHDTQFTGLDLARSHEATRQAASAALAVFASKTTPDSWALEALPASFSADEKAQVKEGCYELLLVLAEAVDQPTESLRLLEQAAQLRAPDKTYHLRHAAYLSKAGNASAAQQEQRAADATPPTTPVDHFLTGWEQYKRRDFASANRHFDLTLQRQSGHFWARCLSAVCELRLGEYKIAKDRLTTCIERDPDNAWLYVWRGLASMQLAGPAADPTRRRQSQDAKEEMDHQFQAALADYDRVLELVAQKPDDLLRWVLLVNRGSLFVQHENWEKASDDFQAANALDARRPHAFVGLAMVYQRQHKPDEAIEQLTRAITLEPVSAALYRARAEVELARSDPTTDQRARALSDLDRTIRLEAPANPLLALDHTRRAKLLHDTQRLPEALASCEAALKVDREHEDAHLLRIQVLLELKRYDDVIRSCDALLASDKTSAALYELRGLARTGVGDKVSAIEDYTQAIALEPGRAVLLMRRGNLYLVSGAFKLAKHDFEEAVRLEPSNRDALSGRGAARVRLGEHREAVADAEKALRLRTPTAHTLYQAATIYARAAAVAAAQVRTRGRAAVVLVESYQDKGTALVRDAMKKLPAGERAAFWRDVVQRDPDPAMNTLRHRLRGSDWNSHESISSGSRHEQP